MHWILRQRNSPSFKAVAVMGPVGGRDKHVAGMELE